MSDEYTPPDLRLLMAERTDFPATPQTLVDPFFNHVTTQYPPTAAAALAPPKYEPLLVLSDTTSLPGGLLHFGRLDNSNAGSSSAAAAAASPSAPFFRPNKLMDNEWSPSSYGNDVAGGSNGNGNSRWPRQETLTLLEIRSRLDSKFKESNQKGPLWDQLSRIMEEEYGYKRSGKKCKEKFDNLYKYYKKTKEGKAGRHDGKHYRFFRQLEAIYGESKDHQLSSPVLSESNFSRNHTSGNFLSPNPTVETRHENRQNDDLKLTSAGRSLSFSNNISSDFDTSSSGNYHDDDLSAIAFMMNCRKTEGKDQTEKGKSWKEEVEEMVDTKLSELMETQETWVEKMLRSVESREKERMMRDEEWRKREAARLDREMYEFCARERAWVEAREGALMEIMQKFAGRE